MVGDRGEEHDGEREAVSGNGVYRKSGGRTGIGGVSGRPEGVLTYGQLHWREPLGGEATPNGTRTDPLRVDPRTPPFPSSPILTSPKRPFLLLPSTTLLAPLATLSVPALYRGGVTFIFAASRPMCRAFLAHIYSPRCVLSHTGFIDGTDAADGLHRAGVAIVELPAPDGCSAKY